MDKKKLLALISKKSEARNALVAKGDASEDVAELKELRTQIDAIDTEIRELNDLLAEMADDEPAAEPDKRGAGSPIGAVQILGTYGMGGKSKENRNEMVDKYDTPEYRKAFMDYVLRGVKSPALEFRTDATAATTDISAVIPTTIMNKVVEKMTEYGRIFARVSKTTSRAASRFRPLP